MLVSFSIDGAPSICAPYDDCIDIVQSARENGKSVIVRRIDEAEYNAYRAAQRAFENPQSAIDQARDMIDPRD